VTPFRIVSFILWDGGLPLLVALVSGLLPVILKQRDLGELLAVLVVPIVAALIRAHHGRRQLKRLGIRATYIRQFLFACSIVALILFEAASAICHVGRGIPDRAWMFAASLYFIYLAFVVPALWPVCPSLGNGTRQHGGAGTNCRMRRLVRNLRRFQRTNRAAGRDCPRPLSGNVL
jgi:hypothetical protein